MTLVEINNQHGAFGFHTFNGVDSRKVAERFCNRLAERTKGRLTAYIRKHSDEK